MKLTVSYSDVEGGADGTQNIDADPLLINAAAGDLRLQSGSPAINAALNSGIPADAGDLDQNGNTSQPTPVDVALKLRIVTSTVDMGAFEFRPCSADLIGGPQRRAMNSSRPSSRSSRRSDPCTARAVGRAPAVGINAYHVTTQPEGAATWRRPTLPSSKQPQPGSAAITSRPRPRSRRPSSGTSRSSTAC